MNYGWISLANFCVCFLFTTFRENYAAALVFLLFLRALFEVKRMPYIDTAFFLPSVCNLVSATKSFDFFEYWNLFFFFLQKLWSCRVFCEYRCRNNRLTDINESVCLNFHIYLPMSVNFSIEALHAMPLSSGLLCEPLLQSVVQFT
jgi:hypothetical protein